MAGKKKKKSYGVHITEIIQECNLTHWMQNSVTDGEQLPKTAGRKSWCDFVTKERVCDVIYPPGPTALLWPVQLLIFSDTEMSAVVPQGRHSDRHHFSPERGWHMCLERIKSTFISGLFWCLKLKANDVFVLLSEDVWWPRGAAETNPDRNRWRIKRR